MSYLCAHSAIPGQGESKPKPNIAKSSKIQPGPSKDDQRKRLGFPWIALSESSVFKGLRRPPGPFFSLLRSFAALDGRVSGVKNGRRVRRARLFALCGDVRHGQRILSRIRIFSKEKDAKEFSRARGRIATRGGLRQIHAASKSRLRRARNSPGCMESLYATVGVRRRQLLTMRSVRSDPIYSAAPAPFPYARSSTKSVRRRTFCGKPL